MLGISLSKIKRKNYKMKKLNLEQGSSEWHEYRKTRVGASDIANLLLPSSSQEKSMKAVISSKLSPKKPDAFTARLFEQGHYWEAEARNNLRAQGYQFEPIVIEDYQNGSFFASLDGYDERNNVVLEIKWTSSAELFDLYNHETPQKFKDQIQWQLMISGASCAWLVIVYNGESRTKVIYPEPDKWEEMRARAQVYLDFIRSYESREVAILEHEAEDIVELSKEIAQVNAKLEALKELRDAKAKETLSFYGAKKIVSPVLKIETISRAGNVDYSLIPELKGVNLEAYRKKPSEYIKVTIGKFKTEPQKLESKGPQNESNSIQAIN